MKFYAVSFLSEEEVTHLFQKHPVKRQQTVSNFVIGFDLPFCNEKYKERKLHNWFTYHLF